MSSLIACNQQTQQPSSTSCKQDQGDQLKSILHSVPRDCNKTLPVNAKRTRSRKFLSFFFIYFFNTRQCTKYRQSVFLKIIYHSLILFNRPPITWQLILIYSISIPSVKFFYQKSGMCYNEWMLQWTVSINKTRMPNRTRRNIISWHSTHVRMIFWAFPLWLERQSSTLLSFVRFSYQFSSVVCLFVQGIKVK